MRHPLRHRLATVLASATAALVPVLGVAGPAHAVPPSPSGLPSAAEGLARYVGADSCDGKPKPGTVAVGEMLKKAYPGTSYGTVRACGSDSLSTTEHYDGRAVDWMGPNTRNKAAKAKGDAVVAWLLATDKAGNQFANARRLGVMYLIWNNSSWDAYDGFQKQPYSTCAQHPEAAMDTTCHRNHIHISLSWEGAMKRTSWWTRTVAAPDYGPCRTPELNWASPYRSTRATPCDRYAKVSAPTGASALTKKLVGYSGMYVHYGSTGPVVSAVQQALGLTPDGSFGSGTSSALKAWQARSCLAASGATDASTWRALIHSARPSTPGPVVPGFDADGRTDVIARTGSGSLSLYSGNGSGGFSGSRSLGAGWQKFSDLLAPGDFTGDGKGDVIGRTSGGSLCLYRGNGTGGWTGDPQLIGAGWTFSRVISPGDMTGDGKADLLAMTKAGRLYRYAGNGTGGFSGGGVLVGSGMTMFSDLFAAGDLTGDGRPDLGARTTDGRLYVYPGNGSGGVLGARRIGTGWSGFSTVIGVGDFSGDGHADLLARTRTGGLWMFTGNGTGGLASRRWVGSGWDFPTLLGMR